MAAERVDFVIVGSGIMGATIARQIRALNPSASILMVDGGPAIGSLPGQHLHDTPDAGVRARFNGKAATGVQSVYVGTRFPASHVGSLAEVESGMLSLAAFDETTDDMPSAALAWNAGGMGIHWTAACPTPHGYEIPDYLGRGTWEADLAAAQQALHVTTKAFKPSRAGVRVLSVLGDAFSPTSAPGRNAQSMPMAAVAGADGGVARVGPNRIFPPIATGADEQFELRLQTLCTRLLWKAGVVSGVGLVSTIDGTASTILAATVIVCADPLRTPQLLWASGIRGDAIGANLNEHAFLSGRVTVDCDRLGIDRTMLPEFHEDEPFTNVYWLPHSGAAQPFHGQLMEMVNPVARGSDQMLYSLGASIYVPVETRATNRIEFSNEKVDAAGLPKMTLRFGYSPADLDAIANAAETQRRLCESLGQFDPAADSLLLEPGSSLHYTGTVRMGQHDDGTSACDLDGRVWGFSNLYVAGGGVLPTAVVCNTTLFAAAVAIRTARAASSSHAEVAA